MCFITEENEDYICICKPNIFKYIFFFPGFKSHSLSLHKNCKALYNKFSDTHNIIGIKYNTNYTSIDKLSSHLARVIITIIGRNHESIDMQKLRKQFSKYTFHVIGYSYGASVAIDTVLKLQDKYLFPALSSFICYKSFNTLGRAIKHQNNTIIKLFANMCTYLYSSEFSYDNTNIMYLKAKKRYIVNHTNDEIIDKDAQFSYKFCKLNRITLVYETFVPSSFDSYYDYFFKCHIYFNVDILAKIIFESE